MTQRDIIIAGAGVVGVWQALTLARAGHRVQLYEISREPFTDAASRFAGAMLAPWCEAEAAPEVVLHQGIRGLDLWRATYPDVTTRGTLVIAAPRDRPDLVRFARMTTEHRLLDRDGLAGLEPDLAPRFAEALYFPHEAHMATPDALGGLLRIAQEAGATLHLGTPAPERAANATLIDCRGLAARSQLPTLRGVRGERVLVRAADVSLSRPVRLLHPRHPIYVVPWGDGRFVIGATVIESDEAGPATVRSALELLGAAYALDPAFAEAEILDMGAGVRPAFPDNVPRIVVRNGGSTLHVNGAYRHGFLLAPVLAEAVAVYLAEQAPHPLISLD